MLAGPKAVRIDLCDIGARARRKVAHRDARIHHLRANSHEHMTLEVHGGVTLIFPNQLQSQRSADLQYDWEGCLLESKPVAQPGQHGLHPTQPFSRYRSPFFADFRHMLTDGPLKPFPPLKSMRTPI